MKRFSVAGFVDVFPGLLQKIKCWIESCRSRRSVFADRFPSFGHEDNHADSTRPCNQERLIEVQLVIGTHSSGHFNRVHLNTNMSLLTGKENSLSAWVQYC